MRIKFTIQNQRVKQDNTDKIDITKAPLASVSFSIFDLL